MAAVFGNESFEAGTVGQPVTAADTAFSNVNAGWTYVNTPTPPEGLGAQAGRVDVVVGDTAYAQATIPAAPLAVARMYVRVPSVPTSGLVDLAVARGGTSQRARIGLSNGKLVLRNIGTIVWTSADAFPADTWCRLEWRLDNTAGTQQVRMFVGTNVHGTVPDESSTAVTFTKGTEVDVVRFGPANNTLTVPWTAYYDALVISNSFWPGPGYTPTTSGGAITVDAGADQIGVEPWSTVTLTASETGAGTVTSRLWTQTGGPAVTLTGTTTTTATFEAPASLTGESLQFSYVAGYGSGQSIDYVNVTVRAVAERGLVNGQLVPVRILSL